MLPAVIFVAVMVIFPFGYAFWLSLLDYKIGQPVSFVGAGNYRGLLEDPQFWNGLRLTFVLYAGALVIQLVRYTLLANGVPDPAALVVKAGLIVLAVWLQRQEQA